MCLFWTNQIVMTYIWLDTKQFIRIQKLSQTATYKRSNKVPPINNLIDKKLQTNIYTCISTRALTHIFSILSKYWQFNGGEDQMQHDSRWITVDFIETIMSQQWIKIDCSGIWTIWWTMMDYNRLQWITVSFSPILGTLPYIIVGKNGRCHFWRLNGNRFIKKKLWPNINLQRSSQDLP